MENIDLTCIGCPLGCQIKVEMSDGKVLSVNGNTCKRGDDYARKEVTNPTRIVTSTIEVIGGAEQRVPVKTETDIAKSKIFDVVRELKNCRVNAPVELGQIILADAAGTGVNVIATKDVDRLVFDKL